ncbi:hypothetical protein CcaverHIS002_0501050 [Cutaneotrichosporon cavernicola]|uniref:Myb-like domain-containing protein n=1 Tax=Cutaneotrichosporon cavernicola TaxID=279322 RepID=A0AA48QXR0_9TREE|nr:uncharacterized protein CcaverHIS019_0601050 [Cutaneotrichosporon cavernicola]BEI84704.1 hypothetical protein CcaverHIS002_0501050 [Cutaneotrichosporon cavernicola]BEI93646.1 hypothetical protein CcaverHIS019_0601050 [Cutaneotrichosporon cavernicola]BEJ01423.1 hypothetical protein CcaverHIS631_0601050 [Cutaneotrichosporon cavernicola]BEJ09190.1 hypothetical protein CcaverHIS641_0601050 [Cutaneotrichosporon cavernicola]
MKRTHDDSEPDLTPNPTPQKPKRRAFTKDVKPRVRRPSPSPSPSPSPDPNRDTKPGVTGVDSSDSEDKNPSTTKAGGGGRKWTTAEYTALLHHALPKVPMKAWEGVVPDRTALQCDRAWNRRVVPKLLKILQEEKK